MIKSNKIITQHISKNKGNLLSERLKTANPEKTMIVPIEIGKESHKALIANYYGEIFRSPFEFHNSAEGLKYLNNTISMYSQIRSTENIFVAMEATGHYYKNIANGIYNLGYNNLFILNPLTTSQCRKAGLRWSKTDNIDLCAIAQALLCGYGTIHKQEEPNWEDLKDLCRYRRFQVKHQTALKNKVHAILDRILPGIDQITMFRKPYLFHPSSLEFFLKYQDSGIISRLRPDRINESFKRRNRRLASEDPYNLIRWAKGAISHNSPANETRKDILQSLILELKQLSESISRLEVKILGYLVRIPAVLLLSIDCMGPVLSSEFAGEITPFEQYPNSRALIKAAGLDPTRHQSATQESTNTHISRKGSVNLRYITVIIADLLMRRNEHFRSIAERLTLERGKNKDCACIATACRFIRTAFWIIKEQKRFQPSSQLGCNKDPFEKIKDFLIERNSSEKIEEYINLAKKYLGNS